MRPNDFDIPFRVEWGTILNKFFKNLPSGYTFNYFFEFSKGVVSYRPIATSPDKDATTVRLVKLSPTLKDKIMVELFGKVDKNSIRMRDITLPSHPGRTLTKTKLESLSKKYFSIPKKYIKYYPQAVKIEPDEKSGENNVCKKKRKRKSHSINKSAKRKVGRPKKVAQFNGFETITKFFRPL